MATYVFQYHCVCFAIHLVENLNVASLKQLTQIFALIKEHFPLEFLNCSRANTILCSTNCFFCCSVASTFSVTPFFTCSAVQFFSFSVVQLFSCFPKSRITKTLFCLLFVLLDNKWYREKQDVHKCLKVLRIPTKAEKT